MFEIETSTGPKQISIRRFKALDGWELQNKFVNFAASRDKDFRRGYTLEVLAYATVVLGDRELPLSTDALIDNHLESWQNVQEVFNKILRENGIDPDTHANRPDYWSNAGEEMATSFLATCSGLIGPAMDRLEALRAEQG